MTFFWLVYFLLSFFISILLTKLFENKFIKIFIFSISFALMVGIWFKTPGDSSIAPILSILLLEFSILEGHGLSRIFRPFLITTFVLLIVSYMVIKRSLKIDDFCIKFFQVNKSNLIFSFHKACTFSWIKDNTIVIFF